MRSLVTDATPYKRGYRNRWISVHSCLLFDPRMSELGHELTFSAL